MPLGQKSQLSLLMAYLVFSLLQFPALDISALTISAVFKARSNLQLVCLACHHILTVHVAVFPFQ